MSRYNLQDDQIEEYFATARERYAMLMRYRDAEVTELTTDPVFKAWRFCNVFREDDKVTMWIREHIREPLRNDHRVLLAMAICRFFNRIETLEPLHAAGLFHNWDPEKAIEITNGMKPVVGCAYIVKTPDGLPKAQGVVKIIEGLAKDATHLATHVEPGDTTLEGLWEALQHYPFFGRFMTYEIVSDLRHTRLLEDAPDIMRWACPGPGCCRGLSWMVAKDLEVVPYGGQKKRQLAINTMQHILALSQYDGLWPAEWPKWEMREVEHWLCEYAKYVKVKHLSHRMKRRYP